jgi:hypothetical protein
MSLYKESYTIIEDMFIDMETFHNLYSAIFFFLIFEHLFIYIIPIMNCRIWDSSGHSIGSSNSITRG